MKLMISVGKGEKSMRLWNLVTGKKAGVLNFERGILGEVGEGRHSSGEGRKVAWGSTDAGEEFCVGFERGALVFGMDSKPKCKVVPEPRSKVHQLRYIQVDDEEDVHVLAMSTEDGRILFYSTRPADLLTAPTIEGREPSLPSAKLIAQLGGIEAAKLIATENREKEDIGLLGRVKDFTVLRTEGSRDVYIVAASSDGAVRLWKLSTEDLASHNGKTKQVGTLLGDACETGNRITCVTAFVMLPTAEDAEDDIDEFEGFEDEAGSEDMDTDSE
jgi:protein MAK11